MIKSFRKILISFDLIDIAIFIIGFVGTLNALGWFPRIPNPLTLVLNGFSTIVFLLSIFPLLLDLAVHQLKPAERRLHLYYVLANTVPAIYLFAHLEETPWERLLI